MIGVVADPADYVVVREFFELFKTPWEYFSAGRQYSVLLCAGNVLLPENRPELVLIYSGESSAFDAEAEFERISLRPNPVVLLHESIQIPLYHGCVTFREDNPILTEEGSSESVICSRRSPECTLLRIGYSLFREIRTLLTTGQPAANAALPALDLHIGLLRDLIVTNGVSLIEIPPVPDGFRFLACLTHDVDHPSIRRHKMDHTMFGFVFRATIGSILGALRGRLRLGGLLRNWMTVLKLPFVYVGLARDFWQDFGRLFVELENGAPSSFFVIPFKNRPGKRYDGSAPRIRASGYGAEDISVQIRELQSAGCEVGLHGIDAWLDSAKGREELEEIRRVTGLRELGARMHWLYFDERSARMLEDAGAGYDSTVGYNETVGYRAGTSQVYKPFNTCRLLELPLHVMDTALFYPSYLDLSPGDAAKRVACIVSNGERMGGCVTVNWHDRSIGPERLWGDFYRHLIAELRRHGAWFATAGQAVAWFRRRRSVEFESVIWRPESVSVRIAVDTSEKMPDLQVRIYNGRESSQTVPLGSVAANVPCGIGTKRSIDTCVALSLQPSKCSK